MVPGDASDEPLYRHPAFDRLIREHQAWLGEQGETIIGSGGFQSGSLSGAVHTDFGPEDQDKEANQDYVAAWLPHDAVQKWGQAPRPDVAVRRFPMSGSEPVPISEPGRRFRFVLALSDGLTTSFRSEWAAALACLIGVRALVEGGPDLPPVDLARRAFDEVGGSLGRLADELTHDPEASCPPGQFVSTWKYILKKGALFQTTLTLAWLDERCFRIAMVGDGGAVWRSRPTPPGAEPPQDRVLAQCKLDHHQVCALGPADRSVGQFDCWHDEQLDGPFLCALHTDGVGRGISRNPTALLDELERLQAAGAENPARRFIEQAVQQRPQDFDDNLTLAVICGQ